MADPGQLILDEDGNAKPDLVPKDFLRIVAKDFKIGARWIKAYKHGGRAVCIARDELCRRLYTGGYSQGDIGKFLGGRDRSSIAKAIQRAEARLAA